MKTLYLIRHARTVNAQPGLDDQDRPLDPNGLADLAPMAARLQALSAPPERFLVSTALRARQTAEGLAAEMGLASDCLTTHPELYLAGPAQVMTLLAEENPSADSVAIVAHNPGLETLAGRFLDVASMPPLGVVSLRFSTTGWRECTQATLTQTRHFTPDP